MATILKFSEQPFIKVALIGETKRIAFNRTCFEMLGSTVLPRSTMLLGVAASRVVQAEPNRRLSVSEAVRGEYVSLE
jgi:hypothetical protein